MNLRGFCEKQKPLDDAILTQKYGLTFTTNQDHRVFLPQRLLALMVEVGETAAAPRDKKLGEYVDQLHFILSIQHTLELDISYIELELKDALELMPDIMVKLSENAILRHLFVEISNLANATRSFKYWSNKKSEDKEILEKHFTNVLKMWLCLGRKYEFTAEEIEQAYISKNKINYQRQEAGY